jgi:hypothetical protein
MSAAEQDSEINLGIVQAAEKFLGKQPALSPGI